MTQLDRLEALAEKSLERRRTTPVGSFGQPKSIRPMVCLEPESALDLIRVARAANALCEYGTAAVDEGDHEVALFDALSKALEPLFSEVES